MIIATTFSKFGNKQTYTTTCFVTISCAFVSRPVPDTDLDINVKKT